MNVGYTPERAQALAARLQAMARELEAATAVAERARREAAAARAGERPERSVRPQRVRY
jgi:hypothetical protein